MAEGFRAALTAVTHRLAGNGVRLFAAAGSSALLTGFIAACSTDGVLSLRPDVDVGVQTAAVPAPSGLSRLVPSNPFLASYPRLNSPFSGGGMPAEEAACRRELKRLGVKYRDIEPIHESQSCYVNYPVEVSAIGGIEMKPAATLNCEMAATFSRWTRKELVASARWRYLSGVKTIHQGSSYSCRNIAGTRGTPSEHALGNALDVMRIELRNGKDIDVRKPGWFAFRTRGFLDTVRADGCDYFTTVLGPGYNADHADHFHFDIKARRNGYRACH